MLVVVLALAVRSGIPMGYMLDAAAMQSGSLRLVLCSFGTLPSGPQQVRTGHALHQGHHSSPLPHTTGEGALHHSSHAAAPETPQAYPAGHGGDDAHDQACPFGILMAQGLGTPPVDGVVALALSSLARTVPPGLAPETLPALPPAGPPLGSRAPPSRLG